MQGLGSGHWLSTLRSSLSQAGGRGPSTLTGASHRVSGVRKIQIKSPRGWIVHRCHFTTYSGKDLQHNDQELLRRIARKTQTGYSGYTKPLAGWSSCYSLGTPGLAHSGLDPSVRSEHAARIESNFHQSSGPQATGSRPKTAFRRAVSPNLSVWVMFAPPRPSTPEATSGPAH